MAFQEVPYCMSSDRIYCLVPNTATSTSPDKREETEVKGFCRTDCPVHIKFIEDTQAAVLSVYKDRLKG